MIKQHYYNIMCLCFRRRRRRAATNVDRHVPDLRYGGAGRWQPRVGDQIGGANLRGRASRTGPRVRPRRAAA